MSSSPINFEYIIICKEIEIRPSDDIVTTSSMSLVVTWRLSVLPEPANLFNLFINIYYILYILLSVLLLPAYLVSFFLKNRPKYKI